MGISLSRSLPGIKNNPGETTVIRENTDMRMHLKQLIQTTDISNLASIQSITLFNSSSKSNLHDSNKVSGILEYLTHLLSLQIIFDCSKPRLIDFQLISHGLSSLVNLISLEINLFKAELVADSTDLHVLCQNISNMHKLNSLKISITGKHIHCLQVKDACLLLKNLSQLKCLHLSVSSNVLGDKHFKTLAKYLKQLRQLATISLTIENKEIDQSLQNNNCNMINLDCLSWHLKNNTTELTDNQFMINALASLPNLKDIQLILRFKMITKIIDRTFFSGIQNLQSLTSLKILEIGSQTLSEYTIITISQELKPLVNLSSLVLHLNKSKIGIVSSESLSSALSSLMNLKTLELDFSESHFESHGASNIFQSISQLNQLQNLNLFVYDSQISIDREVTARELAQCLQNLKQLTKLEVSWSHTILVDFSKAAHSSSRLNLNDLFLAIGSLVNLTNLSILIGEVWIDKYEGLFSNWIKNLVNLKQFTLIHRFGNIETTGINDLSVGISHLVNLSKVELSFLYNEFAVDWERIFHVGLSKLNNLCSFKTAESLSRQSMQQLMKSNVNLVEIQNNK